MNTQEATTKANAIFFHLRRIVAAKQPNEPSFFVSLTTTMAVPNDGEDCPLFIFHLMPSFLNPTKIIRAVEVQLPDEQGGIAMALHPDYMKALSDQVIIVINCPIDTPAENLADDIYSYIFQNKSSFDE